MLPPREHALGFSIITASSWRCSGLLPRVSPVFDRTETTLGKIFSLHARLPELSLGVLPPESSLSGSVPSRHLLGAVAVYYGGSPQYSIVQKLFWGKSFPHPPGSQSCLWERFPPESTLSGSVPSRHLLGAVAVYYRGSPQYSIVQKPIMGEISSPLVRLPELSLGALAPREHALEFGTITASSWRCSGLLPGVSPLFDRTENYSGGNRFPTRQAPRAVSGSASLPRARSRVWYRHGIFLALWRSNTGGLPSVRSYGNYSGEIFSLLARLPELSLGALLPKSSLSDSVPSRHLLGAVAVYYRGSPQYSIVQKIILGEIFSPLARLPELSLGALPPREHALGFGTVTASCWRCGGLILVVSPLFDRT